MFRYTKSLSLAVAAAGLMMHAAQPAAAADFYAGKQMKITIGFGFGGTYGKYSRLFADHLARHIPGNPTIVVESRPGAGGIKAMNYAGNVMRNDGLNMFVPLDSGVLAQLIFADKVKYDMAKFISIGSANQTNVIVVLRSDTGIKKWEDLKAKEVIMGSTGRGSTGFLIPKFVNAMLGTKMKVISGYKGSSKTGLAVEQGEVNGAAFNWLFWKSKYDRWFKGDSPHARAILQVGHFKDPDLPDVPMLRDLVSAEHRPIVNFIGALGLIGRGLAVPAGTPMDKVAILRAAFDKMVIDPVFVADVKKRRLRVIAAKGAEIDQVIANSVKSAKPSIVAAARKMVLEN
jgi:tripartite-type tricarboxylate transporter receptor subunit TctC